MARVGARLLRSFAFGLPVLLGLAIAYAPELAAALRGAGPGDPRWLVSLLPDDPFAIALWLAIASLNAGAAFHLAGVLEG